jgi:Leucine-rich repeat (LRR) protein
MKIFIFISLLIVYGNISKGADAEHPADGSSERNSARVMADFPSSLKDVTLAVTVPGSIKLKRIPLSAFRSQLHGLIELNLMGNNIGDPEAIALAGIIPGLPRLESIVLRNNSISDDGAIALVEAFLQLPNLRKVNFQNNPIGDRGATAIARVLPKSGIRKINLYCDIGDDGAIAIAEALRAWPSLQSLNIGENIGK